ncbi:MAG: hypothetical protein LBO79_02770 [Zoogloeaceae bacterium]|jgi:hypothetical protein|nr:hypothetical protein [Zoogloeaceae bacterium]
MTPKKKPPVSEAALKQIPEANSTRKKEWIVTLAVWGIIPANLAQWLLSGRLRHE